MMAEIDEGISFSRASGGTRSRDAPSYRSQGQQIRV